MVGGVSVVVSNAMCATKKHAAKWGELRSSVSAVDWFTEGGGKVGKWECKVEGMCGDVDRERGRGKHREESAT